MILDREMEDGLIGSTVFYCGNHFGLQQVYTSNSSSIPTKALQFMIYICQAARCIPELYDVYDLVHATGW